MLMFSLYCTEIKVILVAENWKAQETNSKKDKLMYEISWNFPNIYLFSS